MREVGFLSSRPHRLYCRCCNYCS